MKRIYKVRHIMYGFGFIFLIMIIVALFSWLNTNNFKQAMFWDEHTHEVKLTVADIKKATVDAETGQRGYLYTGMETYLEPYNKAKDSIGEKIDGLAKEIRDNPVQVERVNKIRKLTEDKFKELEETIVLKRAGKEHDARNIVLTNKGKTIMDELRVKFDEMEKTEDDLLVDRKKAANESISRGIVITFGGTLVTLLVGIFVAKFISLNIMKPINDAVLGMSSTANEIAATVNQHERTASQQASMVNETTTTIQELGTSSRQTSEQASAAAEVAQKSLNATGEGTVIVKQAIEGINNVGAKVGMIADQILKLGEQTAQLGNLANMVKDLSGEINMLALNAAVEAARAGEHGKGFAVVAGEIRKLANESKKSAEQSNAVISDIQKATNSTILRTEEGTKVVEEVTAYTRNVGELFNSLSEAANISYENAQQVLLNAKQQATAIGQVVEAMNGLNTGARETAAGIVQTKAGIEQLNNAAANLKQIL